MPVDVLLRRSQAAAPSSGGFFLYKGTDTMAFTIRNLSVLAYANGFTLWHYKAGSDRLIESGKPASSPTPMTCSRPAIL